MRNACWVVIVICLLYGRPSPAIFSWTTSAATTEQRPARAEPRRHGQPRADDRQGPAVGPSGRPHRAGQVRPALSRVRCPGRNPAQRRGPPDAVHPRRQRGHAGRLRADPRGGLDPFPRQYLPLPAQDVDPARLVPRGRALRPLPLPLATASPPRLEPLQWCAIEGAIYFAVEPAGFRPTTS